MTAVAVGADVLSPSKALILASMPRGMRRTPDQQTFLRALREDPDVLALRYDGYGNLLRVAQVIAWATMCSRPTIAGICERTGLSKATVKRWIRWLREHGWLGVVEEGATVRFRKGTSAGLQDDGLGNRAAVWVLCIRRDITPVPARRISRWGTILHQSRTGCQWDFMPHDLPPRSAVYYYFAKWRDDGTDQTIHDLLRWQAREKRGRLADPSLAVLDTQSVHAAAGVPASTTGKDAGKRVPGRKRGLAVDVLGLVVAVVVLAASAHENTVGIILLNRVATATPPGSVRTALVDQGFKNAVAAHGATLGITVQSIERNPADKGFVPQPKRWVVEQTYGILALHHRLVRDYEHRPASSESRVYWAMSDVMARRLTGTSTPALRDA